MKNKIQFMANIFIGALGLLFLIGGLMDFTTGWILVGEQFYPMVEWYEGYPPIMWYKGAYLVLSGLLMTISGLLGLIYLRLGSEAEFEEQKNRQKPEAKS